MPTDPIRYSGDGQRKRPPLPDAREREEPYRADPELVNAVNMALTLRRPLLLEGDPGAGKTRLAYAVAYELGWPLHACYVRSTSRTDDLLYEFDQLNRLYDIQASCALVKAENPEGSDDVPKPPDKTRYLLFRPLGQAILDARDHDRPSVVLIDEIDKADIDFPNDLLQVLEEWRFTVKEMGKASAEMSFREIDALKNQSKKERKDALPLVIVTSNREKDLPPAFLRRCLYFFIEFPDRDKLLEILRTHFPESADDRFEAAVTRFMELRGVNRRGAPIPWRKKPGASELIDWFALLEDADFPTEELKRMDVTDLPFRETLVKNQMDREALLKKRSERNGD